MNKRTKHNSFSFLVEFTLALATLCYIGEERSQTPAQIQIIKIHVTLGGEKQAHTRTSWYETNSAWIIISKAHTHTHTHSPLSLSKLSGDFLGDDAIYGKFLNFFVLFVCLSVTTAVVTYKRQRWKKKKDDLAKIGPHPTTKSILFDSLSLSLSF